LELLAGAGGHCGVGKPQRKVKQYSTLGGFVLEDYSTPR
jgi:hypothetical protein